jgi:hypothetical protein
LLLPEESSDMPVCPFEPQPPPTRATYGLEDDDKTPFNADGRTPLSDYLSIGVGRGIAPYPHDVYNPGISDFRSRLPILDAN